METVNRNIHALLNSIQKCQIYKDFKKQEEVLNKNPELAERVQRFRADFRMKKGRKTFWQKQNSCPENLKNSAAFRR